MVGNQGPRTGTDYFLMFSPEPDIFPRPFTPRAPGARQLGIIMIELKRHKKQSLLPKATKEQAKDTGLAMILICLILAYFGGRVKLLPLAMVLLLVTMTVPAVFKPLARLWFGFSHLLGTVMSKVMLTLVFFWVLTPIGIFRRLTGKDTLRLAQWKAGTDSVFRVRDHTFTAADIGQPF